MDKEKFEKLVDFAEEGLDVPKGIVFAEGYEDWQTRLRLARILSKNFQKYDEAIALFESAVGEKPSNIEQFEDIVWALRDLFVCIYYHEKNIPRALTYIEQAITLAELDLSKRFTFFNRGELWCWRWVALKDIGKVTIAVKEAQEKIGKCESLSATDNSYLYYAYYFIATLAYSDEEYEVALEGLIKALDYFPQDDENRSKFKEIELDGGLVAKDKFDKILQLTRQGVGWVI